MSGGIGLPYAIYKSYILVIYLSATRNDSAPAVVILFLDISKFVSVLSCKKIQATIYFAPIFVILFLLKFKCVIIFRSFKNSQSSQNGKQFIETCMHRCVSSVCT